MGNKTYFYSIYDKYIQGDPITDKELTDGVEFFKRLTDDLDMLGPVFKLAANESRRIYHAFTDFKRNRELER